MSMADMFPLVICAKCKDNGRKSTVHQNSTSSTLMSFTSYYDEEGKYHSHNPNTRTTYYFCSNGHTWNVANYAPCPQGDYQ